MYMYAYRNIMKRAKTTRHEKEKAYMQQLRCLEVLLWSMLAMGKERTETKDGAMKMLNQLLMTIISVKTPAWVAVTMPILC